MATYLIICNATDRNGRTVKAVTRGVQADTVRGAVAAVSAKLKEAGAVAVSLSKARRTDAPHPFLASAQAAEDAEVRTGLDGLGLSAGAGTFTVTQTTETAGKWQTVNLSAAGLSYAEAVAFLTNLKGV